MKSLAFVLMLVGNCAMVWSLFSMYETLPWIKVWDLLLGFGAFAVFASGVLLDRKKL